LNNPRPSYWRFSTFAPSNFRRLALLYRSVLRGAWTPTSWNLASTQGDHIYTWNSFSVRISCCIFKRERLKVEWCWKRCKISHFL